MLCNLYVLEFPHGKKYIGMAEDPIKRFTRHRQAARRGSQKMPVLHAIRKYGGQVTMRVLCIGDRQYIADLEIAAIRAFGTRDPKRGYNVCVGGEVGAMADRKHTIASRVKMSVVQKARVRTEEELARMSAMALSRESTPEWKAKLSAAATARWARGKVKANAAQIAALAAGRIARMGPCKPETKAKISAALRGRKIGSRYERTPEIRAKMSAAKKGKKRRMQSSEQLATFQAPVSAV